MAPPEVLSSHSSELELQDSAERMRARGAEELEPCRVRSDGAEDLRSQGLSVRGSQTWRSGVAISMACLLIAALAFTASRDSRETQVTLETKDQSLGFAYSTNRGGSVLGTQGLRDPYPSDHKQDIGARAARLAPAAQRIKELWRNTESNLFHDQMSRSMAFSGNPPHSTLSSSAPRGHEGETATLSPYTPFSPETELHGRLLPSAHATEGEWESLIENMKQDQLRQNQYVMNNVVLLHQGGAGQPQTLNPQHLAPRPLSTKAAAKARLAQLAEESVKTSDSNPQETASQEKAGAKEASGSPEAKPAQAAESPKTAKAAAPAPVSAPVVTVKKGISATESRLGLLSFFADLKHRDEEKTAIHNAKYKALPKPPSPLPQPPTNMLNIKQLADVQKELKWLKTRVSQLQSTLNEEMKEKEVQKPQLKTKPPKPTTQFSRGPPPLG